MTTRQPVEPNYGGRSLAYIRRLTGSKIPKAHSVKDLCNALGRQFRLGPPNMTPLVVGDVLLWPDFSEPGHCTLYLGGGRMLVMANDGSVNVMPVKAFGNDAVYFVLGEV